MPKVKQDMGQGAYVKLSEVFAGFSGRPPVTSRTIRNMIRTGKIKAVNASSENRQPRYLITREECDRVRKEILGI